MTHNELLDLTDNFCQWERSIRHGKGYDYAVGADALDFFKRMEETTHLDRFQVCWILLQKHLAPLRNMIEGSLLKAESVEEHVLDARGYLTLLCALHKEKEDARKGTKQLDSGSSTSGSSD